jgi:hypothetical protein
LRSNLKVKTENPKPSAEVCASAVAKRLWRTGRFENTGSPTEKQVSNPRLRHSRAGSRGQGGRNWVPANDMRGSSFHSEKIKCRLPKLI